MAFHVSAHASDREEAIKLIKAGQPEKAFPLMKRAAETGDMTKHPFPPLPEPTPEQPITQIKTRLAQIHLDSDRPHRAIAAGETGKAHHDRPAERASEASALWAELAMLTTQAR